jgi:hypothetical protein
VEYFAVEGGPLETNPKLMDLDIDFCFCEIFELVR